MVSATFQLYSTSSGYTACAGVEFKHLHKCKVPARESFGVVGECSVLIVAGHDWDRLS